MKLGVTRREMLAVAIIWLWSGLGSIAPQIKIVPNPVKEGKPVTVMVRDMPPYGTWVVRIIYSGAHEKKTKRFTDSPGGSVDTTPPPGSAGGTMLVQVESNGQTFGREVPVLP